MSGIPTARDLAQSMLQLDVDGNAIMPTSLFVYNKLMEPQSFAQFNRVSSLPKSERAVIFSEFCAKYLPALCATWILNDRLWGMHTRALMILSSNPYFIRIATRHMKTYPLLFTQAKRMIRPDIATLTGSPEQVNDICHFFATLLGCQDVKEIPPEDKGALVYLLHKWKRTRPTQFVLGSIQYCLEQLREPDIGTPRLDAKRFQASIKSSLMTCAAEGCNIRERPGDKKELLKCGRCGTVRYCCEAHQRASWQAHKPVCFPTAF